MTPGPPGTRESADLVELPGAATVSFAVRAVDAAGNPASLSNPASAYVAGPGRTWAVNAAGTGDAPTVQAAIDSAVAGDIVVVNPGRYYENIDFLGKDITVKSVEGPEVTILDGSTRDSSVVVLRKGETRAAVLDGFTITAGRGTAYGLARYGGGVLCWGSSPTVENNFITGNYCRSNGAGAGMLVGPSNSGLPRPLIVENRFYQNNSNQNGGGLALLKSAAVVLSNDFEDNLCRADGARIWIWMTEGSATIEHNTFSRNLAGDHGAGIYAGGNFNHTPMSIQFNMLKYNGTNGVGFFGDTGSGAAIAALRLEGSISHNTLVGNDGQHLTQCGGGKLLLFRTGARTSGEGQHHRGQPAVWHRLLVEPHIRNDGT